MALNQDNFNLPLCLHLNTNSLCALSSHLESFKLIILIFSLIHKLYLPLKLFSVEDCQAIFHFNGVGGLAPDINVAKIFT